MDSLGHIIFRRENSVRLAAIILCLCMARVVVAAPVAGPSADEAAYQKAMTELKSGDAGRVAKEVAALRPGIVGGRPSVLDVRILDAMVGVDSKDADSLCNDAVIAHPEGSRADHFIDDRINALLREAKKDEALALAKSYYDFADLKDTAAAIRMVTQCLVVATPAEKGLGARFKRQQIAWASVATTEPAALAAATTQASGSGGGEEGGVGEPVLAGIKADATPYEAAIAAIDPMNYADFVRKGNLLLLADRAAEAKSMFEQASDLADTDVLRLDSATNIARAIRAESGCVGPANAYILSLKNQK